MTDQGWGCVFAIGVYIVGSIVFYWIGYFAFGLLDILDPHRTSLSLLTGFSGALGLHAFLTTMDKE